MKLTQKVIVKSFNGEANGPDDVKPNENYWLLLGETGTVVSLNAGQWLQKRHGEDVYLIQFNTDLHEAGLEAHNEVPNSLWFRGSDLEAID